MSDPQTYLEKRAQRPGMGLPAGVGISLALHGMVAAAIFLSSRQGPPPEPPKVTWVTLPAAGGGVQGGSGPMEEGKEGERQRRVEEVAPKAPEPVAPKAPAVPTPNTFGTKAAKPLKGTNPNQDSLGKAPVASKGHNPTPNPAPGAAGRGGGGGIGQGVPGLKSSNGVQGGTGLIGDLDGNFPFLWYLQQVQGRITGNWNRLSSAQGRVQIYFRIRRDGGIEGARVESPSGNAGLDQSALLAVRRSDPLPRLPEGFDAQALGVRFWFTYLGN